MTPAPSAADVLLLQVQGLEAESRAVESRLEAGELTWRLALIAKALGEPARAISA